MSLMTFRNVTVRLGGQIILHDVSCAIDRAEIVTVVGPNGAGKSTLLRVAIGAVKPDPGNVALRPNLRVGYIPQRLHIDGTMPISVRRFLALPNRRSAVATFEALCRVGLAGKEDAQLSTLSGGQLQRVMLARALLGEPDLLLLDEPTQGLDWDGTSDFYRTVASVRDATGCGVLMVSHELQSVMSFSDRLICLDRSVRCAGAPETVAVSSAFLALFGPDAAYPFVAGRIPPSRSAQDPAVASA